MVSSDDEELARDRDVYVTTHTPRNTREEAATGLRYLHATMGTGSSARKPLAPWDLLSPQNGILSPLSISQWGSGHGAGNAGPWFEKGSLNICSAAGTGPELSPL